MFQHFREGLPTGVQETIWLRKPTLVCDRTRDWSLITETIMYLTLFDPAACMLEIEGFGLKKRTGVESVGRTMGWNMEIQRGDWICPSSKRGGLWRHYWKQYTLAWEVIAYAMFAGIALVEATHW